jgi:glycosyltransferase involved in cell wall biosynthesis
VPNPVDEAGLRAAAVPVDRAPGPGAVFVSVGRLTRQKGFDRVIDMMAAGRQNARLSILGDGPDRGFLEGRVRALGLEGRVTFAGFVRDAAQRIAGADALLLPSRWEGLPNVALEALALGVPVIATPEAGGIREIAALAPPGAITLAPAGPDFVAAMASVTVCSNGTLRPSLLPSTFKLETAVARFAELIAAA